MPRVPPGYAIHMTYFGITTAGSCSGATATADRGAGLGAWAGGRGAASAAGTATGMTAQVPRAVTPRTAILRNLVGMLSPSSGVSNIPKRAKRGLDAPWEKAGSLAASRDAASDDKRSGTATRASAAWLSV
jgi:hypothetical protein